MNRNAARRLRQIHEAKESWFDAQELQKANKEELDRQPRKLVFDNQVEREAFKNFSFIYEDGIPIIGIDDTTGDRFETGLCKKRNEMLMKDL